MPRVLLYEPGATGHRPVILAYNKRIFLDAGWDVVEVTEGSNWSAFRLLAEARKHRADLLYILTVDGRISFFAGVLLLAHFYVGLEVIGNYYLYDNLWRGKNSCIWRLILSMGKIRALQISLPLESDRWIKMPTSVRFVPDPWDPREFPLSSRQGARTALELPLDGIIFTMFGEISERKGADDFVRALSRLSPGTAKVVFVFAGRIAPSVKVVMEQELARCPHRVVVVDKRIPEEHLCLYFCASDYMVTAYRRDFSVSSGVVTRALAAGRLILASSHGVTGEYISRMKFGFVFRSGNVQEMVSAIEEAVAFSSSHPDAVASKSDEMKRAAETRTISSYGRRVLENVVTRSEK